MTTHLCLICALVVFTAASAKVDDKATTPDEQKNDMIGVASFSGVAARNGRISSTGGIRFFPTDSNSLFYPLLNERGDSSPLTLTKSADGLSSTIQVYPGSVSVSASAKSGMAPEIINWPFIPKPIMNNIFFRQPTIDTRTLNPWFVNSFMRELPSKGVDLRSTWLYPMSPWMSYWR